MAPACEGLFLKRGILVERVSQRVKRYQQGETLEIDVLVVNQDHVLAGRDQDQPQCGGCQKLHR